MALENRTGEHLQRIAFYCIAALCCSPDLLLTGPALSEQIEAPVSQFIQSKKPEPSINARSKTVIHQHLGDTKPNDKAATETVLSFLNEEGEKRLGITDPEKQIIVLRIEADPDFPDRRIVRIQQAVQHVPIFGAHAILLVKPRKGVVSLTNGFVPSGDVANTDTTPKLQWFEAVGRAVEAYGQLSAKVKSIEDVKEVAISDVMARSITSQLLIFPPRNVGSKPNVAHLAWMVRLNTFVIFIDAHDGSLLFQYSDLQSARNRWTYDLEVRDQSWLRHCQVLEENGPFVPPGPDCLNPSSSPPLHEAKKAHLGAAKAYSYFQMMHKRESYNNGQVKAQCAPPVPLGTIESNVHVDIPSIAMWHTGCYAYLLIYRTQVPDAFDIMGHEFTHGVIQFSAELNYFGEAGALNESFSDFFGSQVEANRNSRHNWTIGERLSGGTLRDMSNPHSGGFDPTQHRSPTNSGQPDHYSEQVKGTMILGTVPDPICDNTNPESGNDCPHLNSGIFNKAMFLASAGGTHHGVTVLGIGRGKVAKIIYRTLLELYPWADMKDASRGAMDACFQLVGKYKIKKEHCIWGVTKALEAVGLP